MSRKRRRRPIGIRDTSPVVYIGSRIPSRSSTVVQNREPTQKRRRIAASQTVRTDVAFASSSRNSRPSCVPGLPISRSAYLREWNGNFVPAWKRLGLHIKRDQPSSSTSRTVRTTSKGYPSYTKYDRLQADNRVELDMEHRIDKFERHANEDMTVEENDTTAIESTLDVKGPSAFSSTAIEESLFVTNQEPTFDCSRYNKSKDMTSTERTDAPTSNSAPRLRKRTTRVSYIPPPISDTSAPENNDPLSDDSVRTKPLTGKSKTTAGQTTRRLDGIDLSLPPLTNVADCSEDMIRKALPLGLEAALEKLGNGPIRIGTMFSGTESPLIALDLMSESLVRLGRAPITVDHAFSWEIEEVKQAFIERNFKPPILYRDAREVLPDGAKTATTAYGAEIPIPGDLYFLVAGFVCKDISRLNNRQKGVNGDGETGDTWRSLHTYVGRFRPLMVLIENVKATKQLWDTSIRKEWTRIGYSYTWAYFDTKDYYLPQTRQRMYMLAIDKERFGKDVTKILGAWKDMMFKLQRRCSSPFEAFFMNDASDQHAYNHLAVDSEWELCKLRNDTIREAEGLGRKRPITNWSERGFIHPPDWANHSFYKSQSSRVWDCIDIAYLQAAQRGYDASHKMLIWDVSQNVDRFNKRFGIVPCITPDGVDFVTNRHTALTGHQLLLLQGMPKGLVFGNETQREIQDLAGNAMSTTVIEAALCSAMIASSKYIRIKSSPQRQSLDLELQQAVTFVEADELQKQTLRSPLSTNIELKQLINEAKCSSRLCNCEGSSRISKALIKECQECGHTSCSKCAGNPGHVYRASITLDDRQEPSKFQKKWRPSLPARLTFQTFPDAENFHKALDPVLERYQMKFLDLMKEANLESQYYCLENFERIHKGWKITYTSPNAQLECYIDDQINWYIYLQCPSNEPGNSPFRKHLEQPLARGESKSSLLDINWEVRIPKPRVYQLEITASQTMRTSWRSDLGLPQYKDEQIPLELVVSSNSSDTKELTGTYCLLKSCGTAKNSLYKKKTLKDRSLYIFLDSDPIGPIEEDSFIFSEDCTRVPYGQALIHIGCLVPSFQLCNLGPCQTSEVHVTIPAIWTEEKITLQIAIPTLNVRIPSQSALSRFSGSTCSQALVVLAVQTKETLNFQNMSMSQYAWVLESTKTLPCFSQWQRFQTRSCPNTECFCSPKTPKILWSVDHKGGATPQEERQAASHFERQMKARRRIVEIQPRNTHRGTDITIGINVASLVHRAKGRLERMCTPKSSTNIQCTWRLISKHSTPAIERFSKFRLLKTTDGVSYQHELRLKYKLYETQKRSLAWMKAQECGVEFNIAEVEEVIHPELGWRVEAKAETTRIVRGGVLADLPSFGKTVTTIALIDSEFPTTDLGLHPAQLRTPSLIHLAATLIICPPHLTKQWRDEFDACLGKSDKCDIILLEKYSDLRAYTIEKFQVARVVILSWTVIADEDYIQQLAHFSAMPPPAVLRGRGFDTWLEFVVNCMPKRVNKLQDGSGDFDAETERLLQDRLVTTGFSQTAPLKIAHGSQYQSYESIRKVNCDKIRKPTTTSSCLDPASRGIPLPHMFDFNRIVIDEYHYLLRKEHSLAYSSVKHISALKRWALSGTPALTNFSDVNQMASFLGVTLGRDICGDGIITTDFEKKLATEQTRVERFLTQTEIISYQWHKARHQRAQYFLDSFVRQNEPELRDIKCIEALRPVQLGLMHGITYLELAQHLASQHMQIKKLKRKSVTDKSGRLNESFNSSATAEEALLKNAFYYTGKDGKSGLAQRVRTRRRQREATQKDIKVLAARLKINCLERFQDPSEDLYVHFRSGVIEHNLLQDEDASRIVHRILKDIDKEHPAARTLNKTQDKNKRSVETKELKEQASQLRNIVSELASRIRSERFLNAININLPAFDEDNFTHICDHPTCRGESHSTKLFVSSHCGHKACLSCLQARSSDGACVNANCGLSMHEYDLTGLAGISSTKNVHSSGEYGQKLAEICHLLKSFPTDDQAIVFVPNEEIVDLMEKVLATEGIRFCSLSRVRSHAAKILEDFKSDKNPKTMRKALILDLLSESAAGANLVNANHVIFASPLLARSQYEYDSAIAQAIARCRRYGQKKMVHVYHFAALRTIDVDILEHRHRRPMALTSPELQFQKSLLASKTGKKETMRMVRAVKGGMALIPLSCLVDDDVQKGFDMGTQGTYTSLINFSKTFERHEEYEDD